MGNSEFIKAAIELVTESAATLNHVDPEDVYVVWSCKTLQNNKALLSTDIEDGRYYEVTFNGDKGELYLDRYKKEKNSVHQF